MPDSRAKPLASLIISGTDPLTSMALSGDTIAEAAKDPAAIGRLLVDMAIAEDNRDLAGYSLAYERNDAPIRRLQQFETGYEDFLTGGWVRVLNSPAQTTHAAAAIASRIAQGVLADHGTYRGVRLLQFISTPNGHD
jgi:hypothetical protein